MQKRISSNTNDEDKVNLLYVKENLISMILFHNCVDYINKEVNSFEVIKKYLIIRHQMITNENSYTIMLRICIKTKSIQIHNQMRVAVMMVRCYEANLGVASVNHCYEMEAFLNKPVIGIYEVFFTLETILCSIPTCCKSNYLLGTYLPQRL